MSVLEQREYKSFREMFILDKHLSFINIIVFLILQLSLWHGGLAKILPLFMIELWNPLQMMSTLWIIILFIIKNRMPNKVSAILIGMKLFVSAVAILNMHIVDIVELCRYIALILAIDYFTEYFIQLVKVLMLIFEVLVYFNLYDLLHTEKNIDGVFFSALGYDNDFTKYMLCACFIALLYNLITTKKIRSMALIIGCHITIFYAGIGTGIAALVAMDIVLMIRILKIGNTTVLQSFVVYLCAEFLIVIARIQNLFSYIIVDLLGKDLTFTGRTDVWDKSINRIFDHILIGHGDMDQMTEYLILGDVYCHNGFLELLFRGGIIHLMLFIAVIIIIDKTTKKNLDRYTISICSSIFWGIWVTTMTESIYHFGVVMMIPALLYVACRYVKQNNADYL